MARSVSIRLQQPVGRPQIALKGQLFQINVVGEIFQVAAMPDAGHRVRANLGCTMGREGEVFGIA